MQLAQVFVRTRRSLPASDPSPSEVRIPEASDELRVSKGTTRSMESRLGFYLREVFLESLPRRGSDRSGELSSYSGV